MYPKGFSNGTLASVSNQGIVSGGQCKDGLKMVFVVGDPPTASDSSTKSNINSPTYPSGLNSLTKYIISRAY